MVLRNFSFNHNHPFKLPDNQNIGILKKKICEVLDKLKEQKIIRNCNLN